MYHSELGKSTLEIWGEEQDAAKGRRIQLSKMATALVALERQKLTEAAYCNDEDEKEGDDDE